MSDKEWVEYIKNAPNEELIDELYDFGCDPYYQDIWEVLVKEIERRLCR